MKRWKQIIQVLLLALCIVGCGVRNLEGEEESALEYTVVLEENLPEEVKAIIEKEKAQEFQMTYQSQDYLYIIKGYGLQNSGGYSISVEHLLLRGSTILCKTRLIGPSTDTGISKEVSYPYLVLKTEYRDAPVIFGE